MADIAAPPSRIGTGETLSSLDVLGNSSLQGSLTVDGAFTSPGIDDNATSPQVTVSDTRITLSKSAVGSKGFQATGGAGVSTGGPVTFMDVNAGVHRVGAFDWVLSKYLDLSLNNGALVLGGTDSSFNATFSGVIEGPKIDLTGSSTQIVAQCRNSGGTGFLYTATADQSVTSGENGSDAMLYVRKDTTTNRSINAAGTINASGADYAEYELKADGCGDFAKGDVVGFDANGKLTDVFADAVSFAIKSTNPSYVGGDTWHDGLERPEQPAQSEDEADEDFAGRVTQWQADLATFEAALEEKRQRVDRVAYAGKVPVNGIDGATPGHFVLAADNGSGGIKAITKASPTLSEYTKLCVGKVRNNGADGRAIVEVKMG